MVSSRSFLFLILQLTLTVLALPSPSVEGGELLPRASAPVRGVNLGHWFLIEPWMAPNWIKSLVAESGKPAPSSIPDEWTMGQVFDKAWLARKINDHMDSWITDDDWAAMRAAKLTHVRIPVPFYAFQDLIANGEPYVAADRWNKIKASVLKAKQYGFKVWISFHGLPGSQNGQDSSGRAGAIEWASSPGNLNRTLQSWKRFVDEFTLPAYRGTIEVLESVNEPKANTDPAVKALLKTYLPAANKYLQDVNAQRGSNVRFSQHDGWLGGPTWSSLYSASDRSKMTMDLHWYYVYGDQATQTDSQRMRKVCESAQTKLPKNTGLYGQTVIGEFSIGAPAGAGGKSARDLRKSNAVSFSMDALKVYPQPYLEFLSTNFRLQQQLYEQYANGWIQWTWKMDRSGWHEWSFSDGLKYGWIGDLDRNPYGANMCKSLFGI
ncbi:unnamed protein product [Tilletia controversa]|uniref:Glycoside hydrolase family 5 domain-containing protein n=1 Tax=Tilletia controversa TaxID=13291 RepID=A0A8X7MYT3_9BASI|nr:hypothetical protein CF328_g851 [Tilletia controversa]KAE8254976.1 hypothetical protein A4X06_0g649 [Tilletia controversa]CAD6906158.1 unnamed protein product [Tilletia controversa]CAD6939277.1 unnamed protein product [Tilletia controversa]